ncbi:hypothetical protein ACG1BZ_17410 [Microbulbifer sp. CNSA002]|uniref:hypothetical protein n=1 Tax=Microbulbifer sp. CNSA002 TaxID=3373604 RepID=UPI0039B4F895
MEIEVKSQDELVTLLKRTIEREVLPSTSKDKSRYVSFEDYIGLIRYSLSFEPYISVAKRCSMNGCYVLQSKQTNRFYVGYTNHGGHAPKWEIMPVTSDEILNSECMESFYENHAQKIHWAIDPEQSYEI